MIVKANDRAPVNHKSQITNPQSSRIATAISRWRRPASRRCWSARARPASRGFSCPGTTLEDSAAAVELAQRQEGVLAAVGVHPHEAKDFDPARDGAALEALARRDGVAAIGEIGLDFHYDLSPRGKQVEVLEWMLDLAARLGLPAILHNRESGAEMLAMLRRLAAAGAAGRLPLVHRERRIREERARPGVPRLLFRDDHVPRRRQHPGSRGGTAARRDARRDRLALSRPRSSSGQALRAGLRRRDRAEARRGEEDRPRDRRRRDDREFRRPFFDHRAAPER